MAGPVRLVESATLSNVAQYSYASTVESGARLIFLAGACPLEADGSIAAAGDVAAQSQKCIDNLIAALHDAGATLDDVAVTRVLVASTQRTDLSTAWGVVHAAFAHHPVPSTLLGVTVLGYEDQLVEIEAVAAVAT